MNREEIIEKFVSQFLCPECKGPLEVYFSCCYDPECCGILDRVECSDWKCGWEIEGHFREDDEYLKELGERISSY